MEDSTPAMISVDELCLVVTAYFRPFLSSVIACQVSVGKVYYPVGGIKLVGKRGVFHVVVQFCEFVLLSRFAFLADFTSNVVDHLKNVSAVIYGQCGPDLVTGVPNLCFIRAKLYASRDI